MIKDAISNFFAPNTVQYYRMEGKAPFHLEVIETKGRLPFNTCSISIKAYTNKEKEVQIPLRVKWYKLQADRNYEIKELENVEHYNFTAMDIGGEVKATLKSQDDEHKGSLAVIFGPIKFDDNLRPPLESVLLSGFSKFNVLVQEEEGTNPDKMQPISVFMSPNQVKFFYYTGNEEENFYVEITNEKPRIEISQTESENLVLYFDEICQENDASIKRKIFQDCDDDEVEKYNLQLRFFSRNSRDIFVTAIRLFRIVPVVSLSNLFRQIDVLLRDNRLFEGNNKITLNELLVEYDLLRTNLLSTIEYAKDLDRDREELQQCVTVLERDLEHTMLEFRKFIEENMRGSAILRPGQGGNNTSGIKKLDELNASLLSNRGDMRSVIKKKLDETNPNIQEKALRNHGVTSSAEVERLQEELDKMRKLNSVYMRKIKDLQDSKSKHKSNLSKTLKGINEHLSNMSKDLIGQNEIRGESMMNDPSRMNSQMFNMSGIESKTETDDLFMSSPFQLDQQAGFKKKTAAEKPSKLQTVTESAEMNQSQDNRLELRVKDEEIQMLRSRMRDLELTVQEQKVKLDQASSSPKENYASQASSARVAELEKEVLNLRLKEDELKTEADKGSKFIEEFRGLIKALVAADEGAIKPPLNSSIMDESLMNDVFKVNMSTKLKMIDLENENLKKRVTNLTKEIFLLREENRQMKIEGGSASTTLSTMSPNYQEVNGLKKENQTLKTKVESLTRESENLKNLLQRIKQQEEPTESSGMVAALKKELAEVNAVKDNLRQQNQELVRKCEQLKNKGDMQNKERGEEDGTKQLIIDQLRKTNERLMQEINRLEQQLRSIEDSKMSFISDNSEFSPSKSRNFGKN